MSLISPLKSMSFSHGSEWYELSDQYDSSVSGWSGNYEYYGYMNILGGWVIQQHTITTGQWRYLQGANSYSTNFALAIAGSLAGWGLYSTLYVTNP